MKAPLGFKFSGVNSGVRIKRKDLGLIYSEKPATAWGVFTRNKVKAAPVLYDMEIIKEGKLQAILVNSGIANACTGKKGLEDVYKEAETVSKLLNIPSNFVGIASTGKIGPYLPMEKIVKGAELCVASLSEEGIEDFAEAILTTDTIKKMVYKEWDIDNKRVRILGISKGSGMINPDMATTLTFITTDISISLPMLKLALVRAVEESFNLITVDGDTSTNDTVLIMANGFSGNDEINREDERFENFYDSLLEILKELAYLVAKDGEGATKLVKIKIKGADSFSDAKRAGKAIANSLLVKTALYGADPNWGRIMAALGYAGIVIDPERVDITIGRKIVENGIPVEFSREEVREYMGKKEIEIIIDLKLGVGEAEVLTTDLTHEYININTQYS